MFYNNIYQSHNLGPVARGMGSALRSMENQREEYYSHKSFYKQSCDDYKVQIHDKLIKKLNAKSTFKKTNYVSALRYAIIKFKSEKL